MRRPILSVGRRVRLRHAQAAVAKILEPGQRVLDAGCSDARLAGDLARAHPMCEFVGIDIETDALALARREADTLRNLSIERRAIGEGTPDAPFHVVVCADVLEHVADDTAAFRWLAESVRPGGHLIVHVPANSQRHALRAVSETLEAEVAAGRGPHLRMGYSPEQLRQLATETGLDAIEIRWTFHHAGTRAAADLDTWTFLRGGRMVKLALLPVLLGLAALERSPSRARRGNGLLLSARSPE